MNHQKQFALILALGVLSVGVALSAYVANVGEAKADDQTYVYVKGDGAWITEGSVRSYDAGDFTLIQRKNGYYSPIPTTYDYMRIYQDHSLEIFPRLELSRIMTRIEVSAYTSGYASAFANAAIVAGTSSETALALTNIASVNESVVSYDLSNVDDCQFFKFTVSSSAYLASLKITYFCPSTIYEHDFASGELGASGESSDGLITTLSSLEWKITSEWHNTASFYPFSYGETSGIQVGEEGDSVSALSLRSAIPDFSILHIEVDVYGQSGIDGLVSVIINGQAASEAQAISASSEENSHRFALANETCGHIEILITQNTNMPLYISRLSVYGYASPDISAAMAFGRVLEAFDSCGDGGGYSMLGSTANGLSELSLSYLEELTLDDYNNIGQSANASIQKNVVLAIDKWEYIASAFASPSGVGIISNQQTASLLFIVSLSIVALSCFVFLLYRKHRHSA